jgi:hypothetical protein
MGPKRVETLPGLVSRNYLFQDRALSYVCQEGGGVGKKGYEMVHTGYDEVMMKEVMENERAVRLRMMLVMVVLGASSTGYFLRRRLCAVVG